MLSVGVSRADCELLLRPARFNRELGLVAVEVAVEVLPRPVAGDCLLRGRRC